MQDRTTLEGVRSWQTQAEQKAQEAEKLSAALQEKVAALAEVEEQLRQERSTRAGGDPTLARAFRA
jgi:hypothetical protein